MVEVVLNAVLQAGSGNCKVDCLLVVSAVEKGINQAAAEAVAPADAIHNMDMVARGENGLVF